MICLPLAANDFAERGEGLEWVLFRGLELVEPFVEPLIDLESETENREQAIGVVTFLAPRRLAGGRPRAALERGPAPGAREQRWNRSSPPNSLVRSDRHQESRGSSPPSPAQATAS